MPSVFKDILLGVAVGDALGVPFEFKDRSEIARNPATGMVGYGTYNLAPGTFSDDTSLTLCLADALTQDFSLATVAGNFVRWLYDNFWTARGSVFDVGFATRDAIQRLRGGCKPEFAGGTDEADNGNGSLMRILPLVVYIRNMSVQERFSWTKRVSAMTHGHIRSVVACFYYLEFARRLIGGKDKFQVYEELSIDMPGILRSFSTEESEIGIYSRLFDKKFAENQTDDIYSSGYVVQTLEASIWCLLTTDSYESATLKAVNLGSDTDTTSAVTGGLAGLLYGWENIPDSWLQQLARKKDIVALADQLESFLNR